MELGVLELGLKNKQIRNVSCFLKIQVEAFRVRWCDYCRRNVPGISDSQTFVSLFKQWSDIFSKISTIINVNLKESVSADDKLLGYQLAQISLQSCNCLLAALSQNCEQSELRPEVDNFIGTLSKFVASIRSALGFQKQPEFSERSPSAISPASWKGLSAKDILLDSLNTSRLPLAQYYIAAVLHVPVEWNEILDLAVENCLYALKNGNFEKARKYVQQVGLPVEETMQQIFYNVFDSSLKSFICQQLESSSKTVFMGRQHLEIVSLLEDLYKKFDVSLNVHLTRLLDSERLQNMMLVDLTGLNNNTGLTERCLKYVTSSQVWKSLIVTYNSQSLVKWIESNETKTFPFAWEVQKEMLNHIFTMAPEYIKEKVLTTCAYNGLISQEELKSINMTVRRLLRVSEKYPNTRPLWFTLHDDSYVKLNYEPHELRRRMVENALQNNLHYFLYWYCSFEENKLLLESAESNPVLRETLLSCLSWSDSPENNLAVLSAILACARTVYSESEPTTVQSLIDSGHHQLALFALQYSPSGLMSAAETAVGQMWCCNRNSISTLLKTGYPLLYQAFTSAIQSGQGQSLSNASLSVYKLLKDSTMFDISKMFTWQSTNVFGNVDESSVFSELPSFSHTQLANVYGLKANLTFMYYLSKGRPIEAYYMRMQDKCSSLKSVEYACKKASLLAYYNSDKKDITSACIFFVQILTGDSYCLRLQLSVINFIMAHASRYVGLHASDQVHQLGNLTKRACYKDDKRAATRLLNYLMTAFEAKYGTTPESMIEECFAYKLVISFTVFHKLELPEDFLIKCGQCDNWLLFTVFAQMYDYPRDLVLKILSSTRIDSFNNRCIADHLEKAFQSSHIFVSHNENYSGHRNPLKRGVSQTASASRHRNLLLDKIGFRKGVDISKSAHSPHRSSSEEDKASSFTETEMTNAETVSIASTTLSSEFAETITFQSQSPPKDLFSLLLMCQKLNPAEPWKSLLMASVSFSNPVAALFAAAAHNPELDTYTLFDCFACWLYASFDLPTKRESSTNDCTIVWSQKEFISLLRKALLIPRNFHIFNLGLQLFELKNNPLFDLSQFFIDFLVEKDLHNFKMLKAFQEKLWSYNVSQEATFLLNTKNCVEEASVTMLCSGLEAAISPHQLHILLRHFDVSRVQLSFSQNIRVPDFKKMYKMSQCIETTSLKLNVSHFMDLVDESEEYVNCSMRFIQALQEAHHFSEAEQLAQITNANIHHVLISEWTVKAKGVEDFLFWRDCLKTLSEAEVPYRNILTFAYKFFGEISAPITRLFIMGKIFELMLNLQENTRKVNEFEKLFWEQFIKVEVELKASEAYNDFMSYIWVLVGDVGRTMFAEISYQGSKDYATTCKLKPVEIDGLDHILEKLFECGCIELGFHVADLFSYQSRDLDIVYMSHTVAQGCSADSAVSPTIQSLMNNISSAYASYDEGVKNDDTELTEMLTRLHSIATYGQSACDWILLHYRMASLLHLSYDEVMKDRDKLKLLKTLITSASHSMDAFPLAKNLIAVIKISDDCVADFICGGILESISNDVRTEQTLSTTDSNASFVGLLRLLKDPSVLGRKLVHSVTELTPIAVAVETYIRAHDCFTLTSDIEGIAIVLRNVKILVLKTLTERRDYQSMIRLLTGIARYSEMTYIFDILRENEEFEILLGKGIEKVPQLRIALLDFLHKDKEMYPMIAFNFSMHREIAEMMESSAEKSLKSFHMGKSQSLMSFKTIFERILQDLIDASESYTKAGCYTKADRCSRMAQLVALQIHFLPSGMVILNLSETNVADLITKHTRFFEAYIIAEGYQYHRGWNLALFNNVVVRGDWAYFKDFKSQIQMTTATFDEVVALYQKLKNENTASDKFRIITQNMQTLLTNLKDIKKQYEYSVDLQLPDLTKILLKGENGPFLNDLMQQHQVKSS